MAPEFLDFIGSLLDYDPSKRADPLQILTHPFFDELRESRCTLPDGKSLPPLFNFSAEESTVLDRVGHKYADKLIPRRTKSPLSVFNS
jgi:serine/threonine protein kinase